MKVLKSITRYFLPVLVFGNLFYQTVRADNPNNYDKLLHFTTAYAATFTLSYIFNQIGVKKEHSALAALLLVTSVGVLKELHDPIFDFGDVGMNGLGALTSAAIYISF